MSFPAYDAFGRDIRVGFAVWRVYQHLVHAAVLCVAESAPVSVAELAMAVRYSDDAGRIHHWSPSRIARSLAWLVEHHYLVAPSDRASRRTEYRIALLLPGQAEPPAPIPLEAPIGARLRGRANSARRRSRQRNGTGTHSADDVLAKYREQGGRCFYCRCDLGESYHVEHMTPLARGGSNGADNICCACRRCNMRKHTKTADEFMALLARESA